MAGKFARLFGVVVLAASGAYVFVYLYRWEWNRAIIAGTFFLATEVALLGSTVLTRLRALDAKLDDAAHRTDVARRRVRTVDPSSATSVARKNVPAMIARFHSHRYRYTNTYAPDAASTTTPNNLANFPAITGASCSVRSRTFGSSRRHQ
jgi:hypothetical protein